MATMSAASQQVDPHLDTGRPDVAPFGGLLAAEAQPAAVDATLTASRALVGVIARSLTPLADAVAMPQLRVLVVLSSHGPMRADDLVEQDAVRAGFELFARAAGEPPRTSSSRRGSDACSGR